MTRTVEYAIIDLHAGNGASVTSEGIMTDDQNFKFAAKSLEECYKELKRYRESGTVLDWEVCKALAVLSVRYVDNVRPDKITLDDKTVAEQIADRRLND